MYTSTMKIKHIHSQERRRRTQAAERVERHSLGKNERFAPTIRDSASITRSAAFAAALRLLPLGAGLLLRIVLLLAGFAQKLFDRAVVHILGSCGCRSSRVQRIHFGEMCERGVRRRHRFIIARQRRRKRRQVRELRPKHIAARRMGMRRARHIGHRHAGWRRR